MTRQSNIIIVITTILIGLGHFNSVYAQSITITDCHGFTRAVKEVSHNVPTRVEVNLTTTSGSVAEGSTITLTNAVTGKSISTTVHSGVAVFDSVPPGVFSIGVPTGDSIELATISLSGVAFSTGTAATALLGVGALTVGGIAGGVQIYNHSAGSNGRSSGGDTLPPQTPPSAPVPPTTPNCHCDPNENPPSIDQNDFFKNKKDLLSPYK